MRRAFALLAASCSLRESRGDTLIEAVVRTSNMSSPAYWEAHHVLARLRPGDSWFGPLTRKFARDYVALRYARACAPGAAVVLGSGYSKLPYWLARTGAFRVLAASGGFQRGVIAELRTDGARHSQHSARSVRTPDAPFSRRLFSRHVWWTANGASRPLPAARGE